MLRARIVAWVAGGLSGWLHKAADFFGAVAVGAVDKGRFSIAIRDEWEDFARMDAAEPPGLMGWEREFYFRFISPGHQVLVVGCGSGRDLIPLLDAGLSVVGIDIAPQAVERCRQNLESRGLFANLIVSPIEELNLEVTFDRVILSWFCYSYIQGVAERVRVLENIARHLRPGGSVLLSYLLKRSDDHKNGGQGRVARFVSAVWKTDWAAEDGDEFQVEGPLPDGLVHYAHRFGPSEVEAEARNAGFAIVFHEQHRHGVAMLEPMPFQEFKATRKGGDSHRYGSDKTK